MIALVERPNGPDSVRYLRDWDEDRFPRWRWCADPSEAKAFKSRGAAVDFMDYACELQVVGDMRRITEVVTWTPS
jgi:hypothetical protein